MKKASSNGNSDVHDFRKDRFWATKVAFYMLWMEYLAISPSYELARRFRTDGLSPDEVNALPKDFSEVLAVYDDLGDVQRVIFRPWWKDRALAVFGHVIAFYLVTGWPRAVPCRARCKRAAFVFRHAAPRRIKLAHGVAQRIILCLRVSWRAVPYTFLCLRV